MAIGTAYAYLAIIMVSIGILDTACEGIRNREPRAAVFSEQAKPPTTCSQPAKLE